MEEGILNLVKKVLGYNSDVTAFDQDIIMFTNSVLNILTDIGVGPSDGFRIEDDTATWEDFLGTNKRLEMCKSFVYIKVRLQFDPPQVASAVAAMEKIAEEYMTRIQWIVNYPDPVLTEDGGV